MKEIEFSLSSHLEKDEMIEIISHKLRDNEIIEDYERLSIINDRFYLIIFDKSLEDFLNINFIRKSFEYQRISKDIIIISEIELNYRLNLYIDDLRDKRLIKGIELIKEI